MIASLDFESRANRYLSAIAAMRDMMACADPMATLNIAELASLMDLLNDEARKVVIPSRLCANDDGDED